MGQKKRTLKRTKRLFFKLNFVEREEDESYEGDEHAENSLGVENLAVDMIEEGKVDGCHVSKSFRYGVRHRKAINGVYGNHKTKNNYNAPSYVF